MIVDMAQVPKKSRRRFQFVLMPLFPMGWLLVTQRWTAIALAIGCVLALIYFVAHVRSRSQ
jgi:hypothetical protein